METKLTYQTVGAFNDTYINKTYTLIRAKASDVSEYIKAGLKAAGVDYNHFNIHKDMGGEEENPPTEIYEYQNFFLLERAGGEMILVDGFRRLLYCTPPDHDITIRVYQESQFNKQEIMKLMVHLNHFKFYGLSEYYDRGFALVMYLLYGLDIPKFVKLFDAYLRFSDRDSYYNSTETATGVNAIKKVVKFMTEPLFVDNMLFLSEMSTTNQMVNKFFAIQFREFAKKYGKVITASEFLEKVKDNDILNTLLERFKKVGTVNSSDSTKVVRQITEIYKNVFNSFLGIGTEKTYAELALEVKEHVARLKKDKTLLKLSRIQNYHNVIEDLIKRDGAGEKLEFIMVVHPHNNLTSYDKFNLVSAEAGVYTDIEYVITEDEGRYRLPLMVYLMEKGKRRASTFARKGGFQMSADIFTVLEGDHQFFKSVRTPLRPKIDLFVRIKK